VTSSLDGKKSLADGLRSQGPAPPAGLGCFLGLSETLEQGRPVTPVLWGLIANLHPGTFPLETNEHRDSGRSTKRDASGENVSGDTRAEQVRGPGSRSQPGWRLPPAPAARLGSFRFTIPLVSVTVVTCFFLQGTGHRRLFCWGCGHPFWPRGQRSPVSMTVPLT
jgi:hypothetical protein